MEQRDLMSHVGSVFDPYLPGVKAPLIIPIGIPACGKTYLRRWLMWEGFNPHAVISPDDYRQLLTGDMSDQSANGPVFNIVNTLLAERIKRSLPVYLDATNLDPAGRVALATQAAASGMLVIFVLFDTPYEECLRRNEKRLQPVPHKSMERMQQKFSGTTMGSVRAELGDLGNVYTPSEFMSMRWDFLYGVEGAQPPYEELEKLGFDD